MRKALVVGIDYYETIGRLHGCVNDAYAVKNVLERHSDGSPNFDVNIVASSDETSIIQRRSLKELVTELFKDDSDIALFYFSGHGHIESTGGYLITTECNDGDDGYSMDDLLKIVNQSKAKNKIVILDCCHSGVAGNPAVISEHSFLSEGVTILTASAKDQYSLENDGAGVFTSLFVDAMNGSASNIIGDITPGSVYAHIDQSLGPWEQRPIFKTNVKKFISLRQTQPSIDLTDLRKIKDLFPNAAYLFSLDPSYEPTSGCADDRNCEIFAVLQKYNHVNLVKPVDEEHMYYAAMNSTACKLTVLGVHYWSLVIKNRI